MAADCSFFHSSVDCSYLPFSMAFLTVRAPYCSVDGSGLRILPLVKVFHPLSTELLNGWQQITHPSTRQQHSLWFARRIAQRTATDFYIPLEGDKRHPWSSIGGHISQSNTGRSDSDGFRDGLRTVSLRSGHRVARSSARRWLS